MDDLATAVLTASRVLVAISARSLAGIEDRLTLTQFRALVVLDDASGGTLRALAESLGVTASTAMRTVDRLVDLGLARRGDNPADRREVVLGLTPEGSRVVADVTRARRREIGRVVEQMPTAQRSRLVSALRAFAEASGEPSAPSHW